MATVTKRNGQREEFISEKIVVSAIKSGAPPAVARKIAKEIESEIHDSVSATDLRGMVLRRLERENRQWAQDWRNYDRAVKKRAE